LVKLVLVFCLVMAAVDYKFGLVMGGTYN
jgi:hypothetical protein